MGSLRVGHDYTTSLSLFTFHIHTLEKEMATRSSVLAWRIPGTGGAWWAAVYGVPQSRTQLKWLSSSRLQLVCKNKWNSPLLWPNTHTHTHTHTNTNTDKHTYSGTFLHSPYSIIIVIENNRTKLRETYCGIHHTESRICEFT